MEFAQRELENNNQTEIKIICVTRQTRFIIVKQGQNVDYVIRSCLTGFLTSGFGIASLMRFQILPSFVLRQISWLMNDKMISLSLSRYSASPSLDLSFTADQCQTEMPQSHTGY